MKKRLYLTVVMVRIMDLEKYNDVIYNDFVEFLKTLLKTENKAYDLKQALIKRKAYYLLNTDWSSVNEAIKKENLPKISNQTMKDAYIAELLEDLTEEYNEMKMEYQYLHEIWKFKLRNNI